MSFNFELSTYWVSSSNNLQTSCTPSLRSDFNVLIACNMIWNTLPRSARGCHSFRIFIKYAYRISSWQLVFPSFPWSWCLQFKSAFYLCRWNHVLLPSLTLTYFDLLDLCLLPGVAQRRVMSASSNWCDQQLKLVRRGHRCLPASSILKTIGPLAFRSSAGSFPVGFCGVNAQHDFRR